MIILHYFIGFPEERHGGASKYVAELMKAQNSISGIQAVAITPGETLCYGSKSRIVDVGQRHGIRCFEITNPPIEPLLYGLKKASYILREKKIMDDNNIEKFYNEVQPHILHVHTMMGLPMSFLKFLKAKGVLIMYTSHDYYGICPRVNLVTRYGVLCNENSGKSCLDCNATAKNLLFLKIVNSKFFLHNKKKISSYLGHNSQPKVAKKEIIGQLKSVDSDFVALKEYYKSMFALFNAVHFNSYVAKSIYTQNYVIPKQSKVIPITMGYINDNRRLKSFDTKKLEMAFIGNLNPVKGYPMLRNILSEINNEGYNDWELSIYEGAKLGNDKEIPNIIYQGLYGKEEVENVFSTMDLLIVPSIWHETFSLVTMEALSFGTPVIVSKNVGAKMIVEKIQPDFVFEKKEDLKKLIKECLINRNKLKEYNRHILEAQDIVFSMEKHAIAMLDFYNNIT